MEKAVSFRTFMNSPYLDHPSADALERFLLNQSEEDELDIVETHMLACEACVARLETLEVQVAATKLALQSLEAESKLQLANPPAKRSGWVCWLTLPQLSFAGAGLAACAVVLTFMSVPREVTVATFRGTETTVVSEWLPLDLHLNARELPAGPVQVEIVKAEGGTVWQGQSVIRNDQIEIKVRFTKTGQYLIQVSSNGDPLREYSIQTQPLFSQLSALR